MNATDTDIEALVVRLDLSMAELTRSGAIRRFYQWLAEAAGATLERSAYLALKQLATDGPTRITDLAVQHGVEPSTMSRHTRQLENAGLVLKRPHPEDGRVALAEATPAGRRVVRKVETERRHIFSSVLSSWDPRDADRFVDLMERFNSALSERLGRR